MGTFLPSESAKLRIKVIGVSVCVADGSRSKMSYLKKKRLY